MTTIAEYLNQFQAGDRIRFTEEFIFEFPLDGKIAKGAMGTIASIKREEGHDRYMMVKLDDHIEDLGEWENQLQLWQWEVENEAEDATLYPIEVVK